MENHPIEVFITFPDAAGRANFQVLWLGENTFKLLTSDPFFDCIHYGDQLVLQPRPDGEYEFIRKHQESDFHTLEFMLTQAAAKSTELSRYLGSLQQAGCEWEIIFGGLLLIHIPKAQQTEFEKTIPAEIKKLA